MASMVDERVFERTPTWWWTVAGIVVLSGTLYLTLAQTPGTIVQEQIAVRQIWLIVTQGPFLAWAAAVALRHREGTARALRLAPILVLLALAAVASAAWSINPPRTLLESLRLVGVSLFAVALCTRLEQKERHLAFAVSLSIALGISFAMVLLCPSMAVTVASEHEAGAWLGAHGHKNSLAAVCAMALLTLLPLLWKAPKRWGGPTLMAAFMLIMTRSYTAVGTLGCVAAFAANAHLCVHDCA